jgi:K+-transporting ATPase KdpF subunit
MKIRVSNEIRNLLTDLNPILQSQPKNRSLALKIFLALCLNVVIAPAVLAATGGTITHGNAYAIGLLVLVIIGLAIYLMAVMLQPQRF